MKCVADIKHKLKSPNIGMYYYICPLFSIYFGPE